MEWFDISNPRYICSIQKGTTCPNSHGEQLFSLFELPWIGAKRRILGYQNPNHIVSLSLNSNKSCIPTKNPNQLKKNPQTIHQPLEFLVLPLPKLSRCFNVALKVRQAADLHQEEDGRPDLWGQRQRRCGRGQSDRGLLRERCDEFLGRPGGAKTPKKRKAEVGEHKSNNLDLCFFFLKL